MKKIVILICVLSIILLASCNKVDNKESPTATPENTITTRPTVEVTPGPTGEPTPSKEPLPENELGLPSEKAEIVYENNFDDEDVLLYFQKNLYSIDNGILYLGSDDNGETWKDWDCISPLFEANTSEAYQWEFHMKFKAYYARETSMTPWHTTLVGARIANFAGSIASGDDGIWVGFSKKNTAVVYPSGSHKDSEGYWPAGAVTIDIPEGFEESKNLIVVDTGDSLFYYIDTANESNVLILRIDITEDEILVYDSEGNQKHKSPNYLDMEYGYYFKVFNHNAGLEVDRLILKAY